MPLSLAIRRRLRAFCVVLAPVLCALSVNGCVAMCQTSCFDSYATCTQGGGDPALEQHCQVSYDSCVQSCGTSADDEECEVDAGPPFDVSGRGLERE